MKRSFIAAFALLPLALMAQTTAFTGARIIPVAGPEVADGVLVIRDRSIIAVGAAGSVAIPPDATRIDVSGKVIMPGLVDSHSHIGGGSGADSSAPIQPDVRILDSLNPRHASIQKAQAGGITTANVMPGSGHLLSGQTLYIKLRDGNTIDDLLIRRRDGSIMGGLKMANGTNPQRSENGFPGTRARSAALIRAQLVKALEYRDKLAKAGSDESKRPARDLGMEALVEVLDGKRIVHHHSHRADDIMTVLRLADEFGYRVVVHHGTEAWKVAGELAQRKIPASIIVIDAPGGKLEAQELALTTGAALEKAGVPFGLHTDDGITDSRLFLRSGGLAVRGGLSREKALEALTIGNARMLDLADRIGTLEQGKDADFVILSGDPLSVWTKVEQTWVEGTKVFDRSEEKDQLWAVGGWGAGNDRAMHAHEDGGL